MNTLRTNKKNIAIINDDTEQAKHLGFSLKNLGYNVYHYSNPFLILQDDQYGHSIKFFFLWKSKDLESSKLASKIWPLSHLRSNLIIVF